MSNMDLKKKLILLSNIATIKWYRGTINWCRSDNIIQHNTILKSLWFTFHK